MDLSSLYVDITKDRMYCDEADSPRRRATQTVMHRVIDALCRLLAPVCPFTADEAWSYLDKTSSVHLELFPERDERYMDPNIAEWIDTLLALRAVISQKIEPERQAKTIGNSLEAAVAVSYDDQGILAGQNIDLEEFFIVSELTMVPPLEGQEGEGTTATVQPTGNRKCERCWRYRRTVGLSIAHPDLCDRCESVLAGKREE